MTNKNNGKSFEELAHIEDIKKIVESVKDKSEDLKKKTAEIQKSIGKYAKENPWKAIGFSALFGAIISKLFSKK